jgi:hypothetical protein
VFSCSILQIVDFLLQYRDVCDNLQTRIRFNSSMHYHTHTMLQTPTKRLILSAMFRISGLLFVNAASRIVRALREVVMTSSKSRDFVVSILDNPDGETRHEDTSLRQQINLATTYGRGPLWLHVQLLRALRSLLRR